MFRTITLKFLMGLLFFGVLQSLKAQCIEGNGVAATEDIAVASFTHLSAFLGVDTITISQGNDQSIAVEGDSNILENLSFTVSGNTLVIDLSSGCYILVIFKLVPIC